MLFFRCAVAGPDPDVIREKRAGWSGGAIHDDASAHPWHSANTSPSADTRHTNSLEEGASVWKLAPLTRMSRRRSHSHFVRRLSF